MNAGSKDSFLLITAFPLTGRCGTEASSDYWKNELEVRRATRALAEFDDRTLRNFGIPDRSQIEFTVRFCREC